ncbi:hypothetical protein MKK75_32330 [Methylobacterium sp. J-030]|uniref:hypothetical protein n=1 Tax=Methylobacterium sp. J-030 TaxID=2836627 RepID=UPI001FB90EDF|nr:hypothetical protein [Methylobacterium sp. J-030]MCJ2073419.1 hypothetical protein [Methylobacterium sp. J-030]
MMAVTSAGVEVTQLGRQLVRFDPVPDRPGRYTTRGASFSTAEAIEIPHIGAALFSRDGRWVADVQVATRTGYPHLNMWAGDTLTLHEAQVPAEIVLSL